MMVIRPTRAAVAVAVLVAAATTLAAGDAHAVWVRDWRGVPVWRPGPPLGPVRRVPGRTVVVGGPPTIGYAVPPQVGYTTAPQVGFGGPVTVTGPGRR